MLDRPNIRVSVSFKRVPGCVAPRTSEVCVSVKCVCEWVGVQRAALSRRGPCAGSELLWCKSRVEPSPELFDGGPLSDEDVNPQRKRIRSNSFRGENEASDLLVDEEGERANGSVICVMSRNQPRPGPPRRLFASDCEPLSSPAFAAAPPATGGCWASGGRGGGSRSRKKRRKQGCSPQPLSAPRDRPATGCSKTAGRTDPPCLSPKRPVAVLLSDGRSSLKANLGRCPERYGWLNGCALRNPGFSSSIARRPQLAACDPLLISPSLFFHFSLGQCVV
ncbi:hypothetical protein B0J18DRAFT_17925 [Chaetomium sp. MPI-SDFR-AT-0129]|nr:hypothetical protein B0J18DRAFT_17925 [Chaetomium sp. MPI-SDFR-AT-0129]